MSRPMFARTVTGTPAASSTRANSQILASGVAVKCPLGVALYGIRFTWYRRPAIRLANSRASSTESFARARDGTRLYVRQQLRAPDAPTALLCDGLVCDGYVYRYLWDELAELIFEAWRLTAPAPLTASRGDVLPR